MSTTWEGILHKDEVHDLDEEPTGNLLAKKGLSLLKTKR